MGKTRVEMSANFTASSAKDAFKDKINRNMSNVVEHYKTFLEKMLGPMGGRRTGRTYFNVKGKEIHTASASPGTNPFVRGAEWPAEITGDLRGSFRTYIRGHMGGGRWEGYVYSVCPYVLALEFGISSQNLDPRPLMRAAQQDPSFVSKAYEFASEGFLTETDVFELPSTGDPSWEVPVPVDFKTIHPTGVSGEEEESLFRYGR